MSFPLPRLVRGMPLVFTGGVLAFVATGPFWAHQTASAGVGAPEEPTRLQELTEQWVGELFPGDPALLQEHLDDARARRLAAGRQVFQDYCLGCHGELADGAGAAAAMLVPRPRNFRSGVDADSPPIFKFRSTASGEAPLPQDLESTIRNGLPGSSMPAHRLLDPSDVAAAADYLLYVAMTSEFRQAVRLGYEDEEPDLADPAATAEFFTGTVASEAERIAARYVSPRVLAISAETPNDAASVARGREVYTRQGCFECHGASGRGDGSSSAALLDNWGFPIDPRDFSTGQFRAGGGSRDLYLRIKGGVAGTPMPAYEDLPEPETWDLIHFVQSLATEAR